ncbi:hypothetical protein CFK38_03255 [Brachybacterium vulturis]|uniref:Uncharacterized protein n=1 Tax=Brachybacterium vulturis TaxID=2017484 RepID=A0A291GJE8_9MICO|nr:hypothetical protein [Brachybacterium vulturis]ATG50643.1 hypothetical protein CFK38_03255 [Brachybacterium vulturis]
MTSNRRDSSSLTPSSGPGAGPRAPGDGDLAPHHHGARARKGRRLLPALAVAALATTLLAGCGAADTEEPDQEPGTGTEQAEQSAVTDDGAETSAPEEPAESSAPADAGDDTAEGRAGDENLFEGTWGLGHDTKVLSAEELADLLEAEAESRGPEEMSLDVECADGVDTGAEDYAAECTAYADEGVEHPWAVTVGPADAGLEIEVENAG